MQVGAQLWLFHSLSDERGMDAVLTGLAEAGYACVETMYGKPPHHRAVLDRLGLRCYATHVALSVMPPETELLEFAHHLGAETVCVSGLLQWDERTGDDYRRAAGALNTWGRRLRDAGLALHYHNHDFEFAAVEGTQTGMEILLSELDPAVTALCFDVGWAVRADHDPIQFATSDAGRIETLHLRDFRGAQSVSLGSGDLALTQMILPLASLPNLKAMLIEQDPGTETPVEDMASSRRFLKDRFGL